MWTTNDESVNILFLGEVGVGKSTFINSLANSLHYETLDCMLNKEPEILIPANFNFLDENHRSIQILIRRSLKHEPTYDTLDCLAETQAEVLDGFKVLIQKYRIAYTDNNGEIGTMSILDTPGLYPNEKSKDSGSKSRINDWVNTLLMSIPELHSVCVLLKPNQNKFSFWDHIEKLLIGLPPVVLKNINFCVTHASSRFSAGETLNTLRTCLENFEKKTGILIEANNDNLFFVDNNCFRYVLAVKSGMTRCIDESELFAKSWETNVKNAKRLVAKAQAVQDYDAGEIDHTRKLMSIMAEPLAEVVRNQLVNMKLADDYSQELRGLTSKEAATLKIEDQLTRRIAVLETQKQTIHVTICKSPKCSTYAQDYQNCFEENRICHRNCVPAENTCGSEKPCGIFYSNGTYRNTCNVCGCHKSYHSHRFWKTMIREKKLFDNAACAEYQSATIPEEKIACIERLLERRKEEDTILETEYNTVKDFFVDAAIFISENSAQAAADPYLVEIENLIRDEENRSKASGNNGLFYELPTLKAQYEDKVKELQAKIKNNRSAPLVWRQVRRRLNNLTKLLICGEQIRLRKEMCEENILNLKLNKSKHQSQLSFYEISKQLSRAYEPSQKDNSVSRSQEKRKKPTKTEKVVSESESKSEEGSDDPLRWKKKKSKTKGKVEKKAKKMTAPKVPGIDLEVGRFKVPAGFFDSMRPLTNILILGSTGVGKSTFINGLINYLTFESMQQAREQGFEVLIKSGFSHTDDRMQSMRIEVEPTIEVERVGCEHEENEDLTEGQSATQVPKSYLFQLGSPGQEKVIRIIDTPGVGDVRGTVQDQKNFTRILNFIADFEEIHAILLLLEPNKARLDLTFRYCINELLTHLHASAAQNILFCFTKARQTFYRPGESFNCLRTHLDKLYKRTRIEVPLNETNMFTFDNEGFRFLCAWSKGAEFTEKDVANISESWDRAVEQNFKMLGRINKMTPHKVMDTLSVNNIRRLISTLARPLAEIAKNQLLNVRLIEEKLLEVVTEELDQPTTVCAHKDCVEYRQLNDGGVVETIYSQECHVPCYLEGVETSVCPNPEIMKCEVFADPDSCLECRHPWQTHMHMLYRLRQNITRTEDPMARKNFRDKEAQVAAGRKFIADQEKKRDERQVEADRIMHYCGHFAAFLKKYSIVPYNDAYLEYLGHLIKEEKDKFDNGGSDALLKELEAFKDSYEQQSRIFNSGTVDGTPLKTLAEINRMVEELKGLTFSGEIVEEVQNMEFLAVRKQEQFKATKVNLNKDFLTRLKNKAASFLK